MSLFLGTATRKPPPRPFLSLRSGYTLQEPGTVRFTAVVPLDAAGPYTIRERGIIDQDGDLIAVVQMPAIEVPDPGQVTVRKIRVYSGRSVASGSSSAARAESRQVISASDPVLPANALPSPMPSK